MTNQMAVDISGSLANVDNVFVPFAIALANQRDQYKRLRPRRIKDTNLDKNTNEHRYNSFRI